MKTLYALCLITLAAVAYDVFVVHAANGKMRQDGSGPIHTLRSCTMGGGLHKVDAHVSVRVPIVYTAAVDQ